MGVPNFYSWLINRYPLVSSPYNNRNPVEIDWLFLDLNTVVYQLGLETSHMLIMLQGKKFEDAFHTIFNKINEIIKLIDPKKLIYLIFDGVPPRAKMDNQRGARFRYSENWNKLDQALSQDGLTSREKFLRKMMITPGTEFAYELDEQMKYFIKRKMAEDENWRKLQVYYSGMQSAGEGEHKALEFIRKKSLEPGFDTNTSICIYSPDSDLIFLGLSTHLKHLCLFREARWSNGNENFLRAFEREIKETKYDFVWVSLIRDYFELEYREVKKDIGKVFDLERVIDDFIFVFFFIGNDFVPGMLSLEERELNFDNLINSLKDNIIDLKDYITKNGEIIWPNAVKFFRKFARKHVDLALLDNKIKSEEEEKEINSELNLKKTESTLSLTMSLSLSKADSRSSIQELDKSFILQVRSLCKSNPALAKEYYYTEKFKIDIAQNPEEYKKIVKSYLEGIQFLLKYYYKGCPSYSWFYPYHFPPLIIDLLDVKFVTEIVSSDFLNFEVGEPYDPFHHLITTVPIKEMTDLLPDSITCIITDKDSILNSFYPEKFELDCFGARYEKGYIPIIPIIPHEILLEKYSSVKNSPNLTEEEKKRNIPQPIFLFQWDESMENETLAPLNKYYDEIETKAKMSNFDLKGIQQDFQSDNKMTGSGQYKNFPSLFSIPDIEISLNKARQEKYLIDPYDWTFKLKTRELSDLLEYPFAFNYPFYQEGILIAIVTKSSLVTELATADLPFEYDSYNHHRFYENLAKNSSFNYKQFSFDSYEVDYGVIESPYNYRLDSFGQCDPRNYSVHMIPTPLIYEIKSKIKKDITSSPDKDIIYSKGDRVVILGGNYMGRQGIVNKITENRQVSLNLERKPGKILAVETIEEAIQKGKQEKSMNPTEAEQYLNIPMNFVKEIVGSVRISLEKDEMRQNIYPDTLDIGLNITDYNNPNIE